MKWRTKAKRGDKRIVRRFLFFPHPCIDGFTYWLRWADFEQTFYDERGDSGWATNYTTVKIVEWAD